MAILWNTQSSMIMSNNACAEDTLFGSACSEFINAVRILLIPLSPLHPWHLPTKTTNPSYIYLPATHEWQYRTGRGAGGEIELLPQEEEILMAEFIDMKDYAEQSLWKESPLYKEMNGAMLRAARKGIDYSSSGDDDDESHGFVAKNLPVGHRPGSHTIYVSSKL